MIRQRDELQAQITTQDVLTGAITHYQQEQQKAIKTQQDADRVNQQYMTNAERRNKAIKEQSDFLKARAISADQYAKNVSRIDEMYKDPKTPEQKKTPAYHEDAGQRTLDEINQQAAALTMQLGTTIKLSSATQQRIKFEQQIAELKTKTQLTADQKSLLVHADEITQAYKAQEVIQSQVTTLSDFHKMQGQVHD